MRLRLVLSFSDVNYLDFFDFFFALCSSLRVLSGGKPRTWDCDSELLLCIFITPARMRLSI